MEEAFKVTRRMAERRLRELLDAPVGEREEQLGRTLRFLQEGWEKPEEAPLPKRLIAYHAMDCIGKFNMHLGAYDGGAGWMDAEHQEAGYHAAAAAYNREQEEESMEAEHGEALDAGLSKILQDEMMAEINAGAAKLVAAERARCVAHVDWLLSCLPEGWNFARRVTRAVRERIAGGARVPNGMPVPKSDQPSCEWPECDEPALCQSGNFGNRLVCRDHFRVTNGPSWTPELAAEAPSELERRAARAVVGRTAEEMSPEQEQAVEVSPTEWPERLMAPLLGTHRLVVMLPDNTRELTVPEWEEAARRWEAEPKLRAEILAESNAIQEDLGAALRALGISDHPRPVSPQQVMRGEIIPAIANLRASATACEEWEEAARQDARARQGLSERIDRAVARIDNRIDGVALADIRRILTGKEG